MNTLKFENTAKIGDSIRAYDFEPRNLADYPDMFVEGEILNIVTHPSGAKCFLILCTNDSNAPTLEYRNRVGAEVYIPMETGMDFDTRVTKLD